VNRAISLTDTVPITQADHVGNSEWLKPLGDGLHEFRVRHSAEEVSRMFADELPGTAPAEPVLLRVSVHFHGNNVVLLLSGHDKGEDPSEKRQQRAIRLPGRL
jgi:hypothetical protein